jgi:hypothetical protein
MTMYVDREQLRPSLRALRKLEHSAQLCHQVFAQASTQVIAADLRALLARRGQEHANSVALLQAHAKRLGAVPQAAEPAGTPPWLASHSLRTEAIDALVLERCERAEDDLLEVLGDALSVKLEPASALAIEQLRLQTRTQHLLLRSMRDRLRRLLWRPIELSGVLTPEQQGIALLHQQLTGPAKGQQNLGRNMAEG